MGVRLTSKLKSEWTPQKINKLDKLFATVATRIHRTSGRYSPYKTGALVASTQIRRHGTAKYEVSVGGGSVPYAKRRHFENRKNPQTLRYLEKAGDLETKNILREIKDLK